MDKNKVTYGLEKVHIAFKNNIGYDTPRPIPGAVRFTPNAEGDESPFYADNIKYFTVNVNNGYTGELETALVPDEILAEMLGWEIDTNGMLIETADGIQKEFALMGQVLGDKRNRRFVYYDCRASRPSKELSTKAEGVEPSTDVLNITITPVEVNGKMIVKGNIELNSTNSAVYNAFFSQVVEPGATIGEVEKSELNRVISLANKLDEVDYTPESWNTLQGFITSATEINTNSSSTQYQVNEATKKLQNAIFELIAV